MSTRVLVAVAALAAVGCAGDGKRSCPADVRVQLQPGATLADVCEENGFTVIVRFATPQTVARVLPLLDPLEATLACEDPTDLADQPARTCYIVRLGGERCCGEAEEYFTALTDVRASVDVPHPETPCDCATHWTLE